VLDLAEGIRPSNPKGFVLTEYFKTSSVNFFEPSTAFIDDPAREPVTTGYSIPGIIASAAEKTGRDRKEFEVQQITAE
jgi:hypothetical protein